MKRIAMAIVLCAGCVAPAQEVKPQAKEPERPPPEAPRPTVIADEGSSVEYRGQAEGKSLLEVADPFGADGRDPRGRAAGEPRRRAHGGQRRGRSLVPRRGAAALG